MFGQDTLVPLHPDGGVAFPNPIVEGLLLTVQFNLEVQQLVKAQIFNTNGQFVQDLTGRLLPEGPAELLIDMNGLAQGTYVVRLTGDQGFSKVEKIVKL